MPRYRVLTVSGRLNYEAASDEEAVAKAEAMPHSVARNGGTRPPFPGAPAVWKVAEGGTVTAVTREAMSRGGAP
jgi:hypothetical protein